MMRINLCRDRALVAAATVRIRTRRSDLYVWQEPGRFRVMWFRVPHLPERFDDGSEPYDPDVM